MIAYSPQPAFAQNAYAEPQVITLLDDSEIETINGGMSQSDRDFYLGVAIGIAVMIILA